MKKNTLEELYEKLKDQEWTEYMSLKRKMNKKAASKKIRLKNSVATKEALDE